MKYIFALLLLTTLAAPALAERADKDKPVHIEADKVTVDDRNKVHVFEGNVILTQGTLRITSDTLVVTQDDAGFQEGTATGGKDGLAHFRQKRDGRPDYVEGEAEKIVYNSRADKTRLYKRAVVSSAGDEVHGEYIEYDGYTENYVVTTGDTAPGKNGGRVTATIQPKNKDPQQGGTPPAGTKPAATTPPASPTNRPKEQ